MLVIHTLYCANRIQTQIVVSKGHCWIFWVSIFGSAFWVSIFGFFGSALEQVKTFQSKKKEQNVTLTLKETFKQWKSEIWGWKKSKILTKICDSKIGTNNVLIETDVVNEELILLLPTKTA